MPKDGIKRIVMHWMPPAMITTPSLSYSILKSFMNQHGYDSEIIYWNQLIFKIMRPFFYGGRLQDSAVDNLFLAPFLLEISDKYSDTLKKKRVLSFLRSNLLKFTIKEDEVEEYIWDIRGKIGRLVDSILAEMEAENIFLFGFSSKFFQWLPGMLLAEKLKEKFPGIKIVIGGFGDQNAAREILHLCRYFDFAVWGEGEYPLLGLCQRLEDGGNRFESIPRLLYWGQGEEIKATSSRSRYLNFDNYMYPDFSDFIESYNNEELRKNIYFPIESSRGCHWNRCKFCTLNVGYKYRTRSPESIVREIEFMFDKHKIHRFRFADNDIVGKSIGQFERLLEMVTASSLRNRVKYDLYAEIVHHGFNSRLIKKMAVAGFTHVQIGYEAITDGLLKKIDKKADFADHILFVKFASKYGISITGANILRGIIGETEDDVLEGIHDLTFLRFFLKDAPIQFYHYISELRLSGGSRFFQMLSLEERKKWNASAMTYFIPQWFIVKDNDRRFGLFSFSRELDNKVEWENFEKLNNFLEKTEVTYQILENNGIYYYSEFMAGKRVNYIVFDEPEYWQVLKAANNEVKSFKEIFAEVKTKFPGIIEKYLVEIIEKLKNDFLIYSNKDLTRIVSVMDTGE